MYSPTPTIIVRKCSNQITLQAVHVPEPVHNTHIGYKIKPGNAYRIYAAIKRKIECVSARRCHCGTSGCHARLRPNRDNNDFAILSASISGFTSSSKSKHHDVLPCCSVSRSSWKPCATSVNLISALPSLFASIRSNRCCFSRRSSCTAAEELQVPSVVASCSVQLFANFSTYCKAGAALSTMLTMSTWPSASHSTSTCSLDLPLPLPVAWIYPYPPVMSRAVTRKTIC